MYWRWLWRTDGPGWDREPNFSPQLAPALRAGFEPITPPRVAGAEEHLAACALIAPWLRAAMSARQRVRVNFLLARTHEIDGTVDRAIACVDEAMSVAAHHHLWRDLAELLGYHGALERGRANISVAADDLEASLELMDAHTPGATHGDPALRLGLIAQLATYKFFMAEYRAAIRLVKQGRRLFPLVPPQTAEAAAVLWVEAHLARLRGLPERAWLPALTAADIYDHEASLATRDRIHSFIADIALDLVAMTPGGVNALAARHFIGVASSSLAGAEHHARLAADRPGMGLIQLVRVRVSRMTERNEDRLPKIERVIALAKTLGDDALSAQSLTSLGDEYTFLREPEQAGNSYRAALDGLKSGKIPALAVAPQRALLRASGMDTRAGGDEDDR